MTDKCFTAAAPAMHPHGFQTERCSPLTVASNSGSQLRGLPSNNLISFFFVVVMCGSKVSVKWSRAHKCTGKRLSTTPANHVDNLSGGCL